MSTQYAGAGPVTPPLLARVRARRAALEALPRDADADYGHEEGQVFGLMAVERWIGEQATGDAAILAAARALIAADAAVSAAGAGTVPWDHAAWEAGLHAAEAAYRALTVAVAAEAETPQWEHDCAVDVFLGRFREYDLYFAASTDHGGLPDTLSARWSDEPPHYNSGLCFGYMGRDNPASPLGEAYRRALAQGLISEAQP